MEYRREIDGLRTVAVLPVILFHAGFETFSGGFVGVDVFFVISGYLITTIIISELEVGKFSIVKFYERRARRILPALFLVMATCIPFAWFWLLPSDMKGFTQSLIAVPTFVSNFFFWHQSGYFDAEAELKPLLHTWSLAVEEQYYLLFPLFLMLVWPLGRKWLLVILVITALISLALSDYESTKRPMATFFLLPTRAWELSIGSFVAFYLLGKDRTNYPQFLFQFLSLIGLSLLLFAIFVFDKETPFPSLYALVPTIGVALIIIFALPKTWVGKLLGNQVFVGIGLVSYSAYLWHQPLFAFTRQRSLDEPSPSIFILLSLLSLCLAYLTWRFVERPFRQTTKGFVLKRSTIFIYAGLMSAFFITLGLVLDNTRYYESNSTIEQRRILSYLDYPKTDLYKYGWQDGKCFIHDTIKDFKDYDKDYCLKIANKNLNFLLVGDSHGAHLRHGLVTNYQNINFLQATASGCRPLINAKGEKRCIDLTQYIFNEFIPTTKLDGVILSALWKQEDFEGLIKTVNSLKQFVPKIIVLGPTITYVRPLPFILGRPNGEMINMLPRTSKLINQDRFEVSGLMSILLKDTGATYVDLISGICSEEYCQTMANSEEPMSFDRTHFTLAGASRVILNLRDDIPLPFYK
ncbi:MAG: acyltransferase family protein [Methylococcaceae bacterium]|jgi:peptidoglycan/LPS O-acetylase OafA/YrhL